jgi:RNase P protein component
MAVPVRPWGHVTRNRVRRQLRSVLDDVLAAEGLHVMVSVRGSEEPPSFVVLREALVSALVPAGGRVE